MQKTIKTESDTFHENIKEYYQELPSTRFNSRTAENVLRLNEQSNLSDIAVFNDSIVSNEYSNITQNYSSQ